jgi:hypothetical protein
VFPPRRLLVKEFIKNIFTTMKIKARTKEGDERTERKEIECSLQVSRLGGNKRNVITQ